MVRRKIAIYLVIGISTHARQPRRPHKPTITGTNITMHGNYHVMDVPTHIGSSIFCFKNDHTDATTTTTSAMHPLSFTRFGTFVILRNISPATYQPIRNSKGKQINICNYVPGTGHFYKHRKLTPYWKVQNCAAIYQTRWFTENRPWNLHSIIVIST